MTDIAQLKRAADTARAKFEAVCQPVYVDGVWGAYRAIECDQPVPANILRTMDETHAAVHAFYRARDGEHGFLGGRGL